VKTFSAEEVDRALEPSALLEAVSVALLDVSQGRASLPPRIAAFASEGLLGAMIAYVPSLDVLAAKLVSVYPKNRELPSHQAVVLAFDPRTGEPLASMDGTGITAQRTAAASALATKLLAREDAKVLSVVGTGVQALSHLQHVGRVRQFREVFIGGRDPAKAQLLADRFPGARAVSIDEAVSRADVLCATTHAKEPLVKRALVRPGTHVNSVGLNEGGSELEAALFEVALLAVESRKSSFAPPPAGARELIGRDPLQAVELGELISGARKGRSSSDQITLYKSVGIAAEDAAAASLVLR
jgi:ornithine cyclodeaminase